jgi:methyl-accepting chemotaxis protein
MHLKKKFLIALSFVSFLSILVIFQLLITFNFNRYLLSESGFVVSSDHVIKISNLENQIRSVLSTSNDIIVDRKEVGAQNNSRFGYIDTAFSKIADSFSVLYVIDEKNKDVIKAIETKSDDFKSLILGDFKKAILSNSDDANIAKLDDVIDSYAEDLLLKVTDYKKIKEDKIKNLKDKIYKYSLFLKILVPLVVFIVVFIVLPFILSAYKSFNKSMSEVQNIIFNLRNNNYDVVIHSNVCDDEFYDIFERFSDYKNLCIKYNEINSKAQNQVFDIQSKIKQIEGVISSFENKLMNSLSQVNTAAEFFSSISGDLSRSLVDLTERSSVISQNSTAAFTNVVDVVESSDKLSLNVTQISNKVDESSTVVTEAVKRASDADKAAQELASVSHTIENITTVIENIAEQINLLALNATIESARAGEAGKGFAVVANEIKSLASQTTKATEEIGQQIKNVQSIAQNVASVLEVIKDSINKVNEFTSTMSTTMSEQFQFTSGINKSMKVAKDDVEKINVNLVDINKVSDHLNQESERVSEAAKGIMKESKNLSQEITNFLHEIKST